MPVGERHQDRAVRRRVVLRVRPHVAPGARRAEHERPRPAPALPVDRRRVVRVPARAAHEQEHALAGDDRVRVRVAEPAAGRQRHLPRAAPGPPEPAVALGDPVLHPAVAVARVDVAGVLGRERVELAPEEHEARVVVVVDLEPAEQRQQLLAPALDVVLVELDLAVGADAARVDPVAVRDRARVAEVRPRARRDPPRGARMRDRRVARVEQPRVGGEHVDARVGRRGGSREQRQGEGDEDQAGRHVGR